MKDILIIAHFTQAPNEPGNNRFHYIANELAGNIENSVEVITTSFSHRYKKQRKLIVQELDEISYQFSMIYEPGYPTNVCLRRFYSHYIMGRNLKKYLIAREKPDVIYCAVPSLSVAKAAAEYAERNNIRLIVDVQDLWPEAFKMVFHIPFLSNLIFAPMKWQADYIYRQADEIIAVSDTYVNRALEVNKKCKKGYTIFLGTLLSDFDKNVRENPVNTELYKDFKIKKESKDEKLFLAYCGTLGSSYDLTCVIDALVLVKKIGMVPPGFVVMGDGPRREEFEKYADKRGIDTLFTGRIPYAEMCAMLSECDITVNPIVKGSASSIINKHADYAASGLPVLNTQECEEYRKLVDDYKMGFNCRNNDAEDLAEKLIQLLENKDLRLEMGKNARRCAEEKFDRKNSYQEILKLAEN